MNPVNIFLEIKFLLLFSVGRVEGLDFGSKSMPAAPSPRPSFVIV